MSVGFRVFSKRKLPSPAVVKALGELPSANVADVMTRLNSLLKPARACRDRAWPLRWQAWRSRFR